MNFIVMVHMEHTSINGGTTCEFEMSRRISDNGYPVKIYYPYGDVTSGIYDNYATLEDVNDDTVAIYCAHRHGNPLNAKRVVRWVAYGLPNEYYDSFSDTDIIYYHLPFCKNNLTKQRLFSCRLSPDVKNNRENRVNELCFIVKKGYKFWKNSIRRDTNTFPHQHMFKNRLSFLKTNSGIDLAAYSSQTDYISIFNKTKYFFCYDPCTFLVIIALLCGCIVIQDPVDGYTEEEWIYATLGINSVKLKGLAYGIENIKYAEDTIQDAYGPCMDIINQADGTIKQFLYDMEHKTYNTDRCYKYSESPFSLMF